MATFNSTVPDDLEREVQETFAAGPMREAVAERRRQEGRAAAIDALLGLRSQLPTTSAAQVERARKAGRP